MDGDKIGRRAKAIRQQEVKKGGEGSEASAPERMEGEEADAVAANRDMKRQAGGGDAGTDPAFGAGLAAGGVRLNSTSRAKHSAPGGKDASLDGTGGSGSRGRYADR
jgi:hypothetical protein